MMEAYTRIQLITEVLRHSISCSKGPECPAMLRLGEGLRQSEMDPVAMIGLAALIMATAYASRGSLNEYVEGGIN